MVKAVPSADASRITHHVFRILTSSPTTLSSLRTPSYQLVTDLSPKLLHIQNWISGRFTLLNQGLYRPTLRRFQKSFEFIGTRCRCPVVLQNCKDVSPGVDCGKVLDGRFGRRRVLKSDGSDRPLLAHICRSPLRCAIGQNECKLVFQ